MCDDVPGAPPRRGDAVLTSRAHQRRAARAVRKAQKKALRDLRRDVLRGVEALDFEVELLPRGPSDCDTYTPEERHVVRLADCGPPLACPPRPEGVRHAYAGVWVALAHQALGARVYGHGATDDEAVACALERLSIVALLLRAARET